MESRMLEFITQYASQGSHRTATEVDNASAEWLASNMQRSAPAATVSRSTFRTRRRVPLAGSLAVAVPGQAPLIVRGVPLFDCGSYTEVQGVEGALGQVDAECDIAIVTYSAAAGSYGDADDLARARKSGKHRAVVAVWKPPPGASEGLALVNGEWFPEGGKGPPALHVHSEHLSALLAAAAAGARATLTACMTESEAEAANVEAEVLGSDPSLAPILVLTPRSGWWGCAVERGASLAAFVELLRAVAAAGPRRTVRFCANTGHELGHTGYRHFSASNPEYEKRAHLCVHIGANWASRHVGPSDKAALAQISDPEAEALLLPALAREGLGEDRLIIRRGDTRPQGEARNLYDKGARYISVLGPGLREFHMEEDVETNVQMPLLSQLTRAVIDAVLQAADCQEGGGGARAGDCQEGERGSVKRKQSSL